MPKKGPRDIIECGDCGKLKSHYAKRLCVSCYNRQRYAAAAKVPCARCHKDRFHFCHGLCRACYRTERKFQKKYGIEFADYDVMLQVQAGRCIVCDREFGKRKPHVDHCHSTGMVRGLLCYTCNVGLGSFGDDPDRLRSAALYIESHRARKVA